MDGWSRIRAESHRAKGTAPLVLEGQKMLNDRGKMGAVGQALNAWLTMPPQEAGRTLHDIRTFLGAVLLAAAALGLVASAAGPFVTAPIDVEFVSTGVVIVGSVVAGIAAVCTLHRRPGRSG